MHSLIRGMWVDDSRQGPSEYALIVAIVALGVMAALIVMREEPAGAVWVANTELGWGFPACERNRITMGLTFPVAPHASRPLPARHPR